jgi:hypothetical protein
VIARFVAIGAAFALVAVAVPVRADEVGGEDITMPMARPPAPAVVVEEPVKAPPPPFVTIESRTLAAGLGIRWGQGTLLFEGERYPFSLKGVSLGELGVSALEGEGWVRNLENISDFAGHYVAVEAGAAAGVGASALTMRNEHGVVITLRSELEGVRLKLGTDGLRIALE